METLDGNGYGKERHGIAHYEAWLEWQSSELTMPRHRTPLLQ